MFSNYLKQSVRQWVSNKVRRRESGIALPIFAFAKPTNSKADQKKSMNREARNRVLA